MKKLWYSTAYLTASLLLIIATLLLLPVTSQARYSASPQWLSTYTPTADAPAFSSDLLADVGEIYLLDWDVSQNNKKQLTFCICFPVEEILAEDVMPILYAEKTVTVDCAVSDNCVTAEATATDGSEVPFPADYIIPADGQEYLIKVNLTCEELQEKEIAVTITAAYGEETLTGTVNITLLTGTETPFGSGYASQVSEDLLVMQTSYDPTQLICAALTLPNGCEKAELSTGIGIAFPAKTRFSFNGEDWRTLYEADTISVPLTSTYVQLDLSETELSAVPHAIRLRLDACIQGEEQEGTPLYLYQMTAESAYVEWNALWQGSRVIRATSSRALLLPDNGMTVEGMVQMLMPLPEEEQSDSAEETEGTDIPALVWTDVESVKLEMKEISQPTQDPLTPETISSLVVDAGEAAAGSYRLVITWKLGDTRVRTEYIPFFVVN